MLADNIKNRITTYNTNYVSDCKSVLYVMSRDQRTGNNHALYVASLVANKLNVPLHVVFFLYKKSTIALKNQFQFMLEGFPEIEESLKSMGISFEVVLGKDEQTVKNIVRQYNPGALVFDFSPLVGHRNFIKKVIDFFPGVILEVDTHNMVPVAEVSDKREWAAYTIRPKIMKQLPLYIEEVPEIELTHKSELTPKNDYMKLLDTVMAESITSYKPVVKPGRKNAMVVLNEFLKNKADSYDNDRNDPTKDGQSNLSAYLHFGTLSALDVLLEIKAKYGADFSLYSESIKAFIEELVVRKELSDNYCLYNQSYKSTSFFPEWAKKTLAEHANDKREFIYTKTEFEECRTHDAAWNAAQRQLATTGKMHGYMRMYWAKKILEWTNTSKDAMDIAIYLNDKYELDGRDPNGYTGIAWSIGGVHDRPWFERPIFGLIRYMNESGLQSKFDLKKYISVWSNKS